MSRVKRLDQVKKMLDEAMNRYNPDGFIHDDPIQIPKRFKSIQDQEISGFIAATLAWGQRKSIIRSAERWMELMDHAPYDFVMNHEESDLTRFKGYVHRTFQEADAQFFVHALQHIYRNHTSLEEFWTDCSVKEGIVQFRKSFFDAEESLQRTQKHVANPEKKSACKRINMFLKWMVRTDPFGIDLGIWNRVSPAKLMIPLDVHVHRTALSLGIIKRKQADWQAVEELTNQLRRWDARDPVKYDYGLFVLSHSGELPNHP
jgi:uncharacterized protein (TIGR02757 family)